MSNTLTRILVAVIAIPLILYTVYYGSYPYFAFCLIIEVLCFYEFLKMFENKGYRTYIYLNIFFSAVLFSVFIFAHKYIIYTPALIFLLFVIEHFRKEKRNIFNPFLVTFGFIYIALPLSLLYGLGKDYLHVYYLLVLIWSCDSFAFFGGKLFGKHKLTSISPGKTIEGSVSGFVFTVVLSVVFHYIFPGSVTFIDSLIVGAFVGIFAQTGDLLESFFKRYTGVKDSSHIIPGHGGLLDRFDSLIFCVPPVYIYFYFIKIFLN
jgi:phosphatidate cytidylyltransferase